MTDQGQPIHVDPDAESADPDMPAFIARPEGEPVYHGFPLLDVEVQGFRLGTIAGFALDELGDPDEDGTSGDAFVVGPDGRRAGLVWDVEDETHFTSIEQGIGEQVWRRLPRQIRRRRERVGVYGVGFLLPMRTLDNARANLASIVPMLQSRMGAMNRLEGKVCVITGAGGGMGREAAIVFTGEGAKVCVADVDEALAEETVSLCSGEAFACRADVADEGEVERMYAETAERFGGVDVLYNNAGISPGDDASVLDTSVEAWQRVQDVNTMGVFLCCKHGIPHLLERGGGSVINVASFVAILGAATSRSRTPRRRGLSSR